MPEPDRPEPKKQRTNHKKLRDTSAARAAAKAKAKERRDAKMAKKKRDARAKAREKKIRPVSPGELATIKAYLDPSCASWVEAIKIGYPKRRHRIAAYAAEVFARPPVKQELERRRKLISRNVMRHVEVTAADIIEQCRRLAFTDVTDILQYEKGKDRWGRPVYTMKMADFEELTPEIRAAIRDIKVKTIQRKGKDELLIQEIEIKMYDKQAALRDLGKHFNLFVEKIDVNHTGTVGHVHTTTAEMRAAFEAMSQDDREAWIAKRMETIRGEDDE